MASTRSGRGRPSASKRRKTSLRPRPASMRRVVCSVSSNVQLPVLPEARIETRKEIASSERDHCREQTRGKAKTWPVSHEGTEERPSRQPALTKREVGAAEKPKARTPAALA